MKSLTAETFLTRLWPAKLLRNETLELRAIKRKSGTINRNFFTSIDSFLKAAREYGEGWDIYFGVSTRYLHGGKKQDCYRLKTVWVDFDKVDKLPDFGDLPPDLVVNSGAGFHVYWILEEPIFVRTGRWKEIEAVNRALAKKFGGDPMAIDASRILRVPELYNYKYDPPRKVIASAEN